MLDGSKLVMDAPGYVGLKFTQFMPGAILGVDDLIASLLDRPDALHAFMWFFTVAEGLVGLALLLGLGTRVAGFGALALSVGILLGSGWLGPTCLDEWQIGSLGAAAGAVVLLAGPGRYSLDALLHRRLRRLPRLQRLVDPRPWWSRPAALGLAGFSLALTLATNQVFHGGLWGPLHNDSVRPFVQIEAASISDSGALSFTAERPHGPETYGAFVIAVRVRDSTGAALLERDGEALAATTPAQIVNRWPVAVHAGAHALVFPLGGRAEITLPRFDRHGLPAGIYTLELEDVSGARWTAPLEVHPRGPCDGPLLACDG